MCGRYTTTVDIRHDEYHYVMLSRIDQTFICKLTARGRW
jgi:hypothetical protein